MTTCKCGLNAFQTAAIKDVLISSPNVDGYIKIILRFDFNREKNNIFLGILYDFCERESFNFSEFDNELSSKLGIEPEDRIEIIVLLTESPVYFQNCKHLISQYISSKFNSFTYNDSEEYDSDDPDEESEKYEFDTINILKKRLGI